MIVSRDEISVEWWSGSILRLEVNFKCLSHWCFEHSVRLFHILSDIPFCAFPSRVNIITVCRLQYKNTLPNYLCILTTHNLIAYLTFLCGRRLWISLSELRRNQIIDPLPFIFIDLCLIS